MTPHIHLVTFFSYKESLALPQMFLEDEDSRVSIDVKLLFGVISIEKKTKINSKYKY